MRTLTQWFDAYAVSHQNRTNKNIHYICVPAIFFSIVGLFLSIPTRIIANNLGLNLPMIENFAFVVLVFLQVFYFRLSFSLGLKMMLFSVLCLVGNFYIGQYFNLFLFSVGVFVLAWIGQFYGHKIEGKKPSFIDDLQFLLIGPAWVIENVFGTKN